MVYNSYSRVVVKHRSTSFGPCVRVLSRILPRPTSTLLCEGGRIVVKSLFLVMFEYYLRIVTNACARLFQFRQSNRGNMVSSGVFGVFPLFLSLPILLASYHSGGRTVAILYLWVIVLRLNPLYLYRRRFRSLPFRLPNLGDIVSLVESHLYFIEAHQ